MAGREILPELTPFAENIAVRWSMLGPGAAVLCFAMLRFQAPETSEVETPFKINRLVLTASGTPGAYDSDKVDSPFVFRNGREWYMLFVAFDGTGYQTGLAKSKDLIHWDKMGCILKRDPASDVTKYNVALSWLLRDNNVRSTGSLRKVSGQFVGVYHAYPKPGYEEGPAEIGLAFSSDLHHWRLNPPILRAQDGEAWEKGGLYKPCLVRKDGKYYLFYNAKNRAKWPWREQTGVAVSKDLKRWTRYTGNPIIRNGPAGSPDEIFASDPCVLLNGEEWLFFYYGLDAKGVARDLVAVGSSPFQPRKAERVLIDVGARGSVDSVYAHKPSIVSSRGVLYHFYCAVSRKKGKEVRGISVARSIPWKR